MVARDDMASYMRERRARRRAKLIELSGGKCARCDSTKDLEFNHIDREAKEFTLSGRGLDGPWEKLLAEADKCEVLCHDHHREYTNEQYRSGQIKVWNDLSHVPREHGSPRMYTEEKCRCLPCKTAYSMYRRKEATYHQVVDPQ